MIRRANNLVDEINGCTFSFFFLGEQNNKRIHPEIAFMTFDQFLVIGRTLARKTTANIMLAKLARG